MVINDLFHRNILSCYQSSTQINVVTALVDCVSYVGRSSIYIARELSLWWDCYASILKLFLLPLK